MKSSVYGCLLKTICCGISLTFQITSTKFSEVSPKCVERLFFPGKITKDRSLSTDSNRLIPLDLCKYSPSLNYCDLNLCLVCKSGELVKKECHTEVIKCTPYIFDSVLPWVSQMFWNVVIVHHISCCGTWGFPPLILLLSHIFFFSSGETLLLMLPHSSFCSFLYSPSPFNGTPVLPFNWCIPAQLIIRSGWVS